MIETKEKTINGHAYQVQQFPAMTGLRLAVKVVKTLGAGIAKMGDIKGGFSGLMNMDTSDLNIGDMVEGLLGKLDDENTPKLILELFAATWRDGVELNQKNFDMAYAANYIEMGQAIAFIIEVNYGDFFGVLEAGKTGIGKAPSSAANQRA